MKLENELLGAGELLIDHKKDIFFARSSAATCTNCPLEADQRSKKRSNKPSGVDTAHLCVDTSILSQKHVLRETTSGVDTVLLCLDTSSLSQKLSLRPMLGVSTHVCVVSTHFEFFAKSKMQRHVNVFGRGFLSGNFRASRSQDILWTHGTINAPYPLGFWRSTHLLFKSPEFSRRFQKKAPSGRPYHVEIPSFQLSRNGSPAFQFFLPTVKPPSLPIFLSIMPPKQTPKRGAKSRAAARGVVIEEPQPERRRKFRHDLPKRKGVSSPSGTPSKRGRLSPQSKGKSPMPSRYPRRKLLPDSSDSDEEDSSSESSDSSGTPAETTSGVDIVLLCVDTSSLSQKPSLRPVLGVSTHFTCFAWGLRRWRPGFTVLSVKTTDLGVALRMQQPDPSHSTSECAVSRCHVLKATVDPAAFMLPRARGLCMVM
ncbi:hypothetical protein Taro_034470 [Colocasia esculenta]|uniref:Uncharacterized protein n=1 Tax=Colocasia esculenta TaxID=4460 RepID=A0A843WC09_COLES|nr:hypothetical protein [Colocasia esculenta]